MTRLARRGGTPHPPLTTRGTGLRVALARAPTTRILARGWFKTKAGKEGPPGRGRRWRWWHEPDHHPRRGRQPADGGPETACFGVPEQALGHHGQDRDPA